MKKNFGNLYDETCEILARNGKAIEDIQWVSLGGSRWGSVASFSKAAREFTYDPGYGGQEVNSELVLVGPDFWLERNEYDGSEWWEYKAYPGAPDEDNFVEEIGEFDLAEEYSDRWYELCHDISKKIRDEEDDWEARDDDEDDEDYPEDDYDEDYDYDDDEGQYWDEEDWDEEDEEEGEE
jgi:hypothetical protein